MFLPTDIMVMKKKYPDAELLVHPECNPELREMADQVLSTGGMVHYVASSPKNTFLIGTEVDMVTRLSRENPDKTILPLLSEAICENMKLHTLEKVKNSLINEEYPVVVGPEIADQARTAVERMLALSR
jgi:quinolinate synthase